jgi:hypothetical protein
MQFFSIMNRRSQRASDASGDTCTDNLDHLTLCEIITLYRVYDHFLVRADTFGLIGPTRCDRFSVLRRYHTFTKVVKKRGIDLCVEIMISRVFPLRVMARGPD